METVFMIGLIAECAFIALVLFRFSNIVIELLIEICADVDFIKDLIGKGKANEIVDRLVKEGYVSTGKKVQ